jgi:hypothetical protein
VICNKIEYVRLQLGFTRIRIQRKIYNQRKLWQHPQVWWDVNIHWGFDAKTKVVINNCITIKPLRVVDVWGCHQKGFELQWLIKIFICFDWKYHVSCHQLRNQNWYVAFLFFTTMKFLQKYTWWKNFNECENLRKMNSINKRNLHVQTSILKV